jgi:hypothetical protein
MRRLFRRQARSLKRTALGGTAGLLMIMGGAAMAQPPEPSPMGERHLPGATQLFISPMGQPFRAGPDEPYPVARWFATADKDGDGRIERSEFRADAEIFFRALDSNRDGVIDGFELSNYEHNVAPEILGVYRVAGGPTAAEPSDDQRKDRRKGGRGRRDDTGDRLTGGATIYELIAIPEPVAAADRNLTGRVTLAEFLDAADQRFDQLDSKGLGYLTLAGLPKTPIQLAAERVREAQNKR